ncbi:MAG: sulfatase-like hydrolase/transferase [Armatimonadetes bacterium]|nr:sulfatase-like hydrolase/transferase [Armatimonadota bacterium]
MLVSLALMAVSTTAPVNVVFLFTDDHRRTAVGALGIEPVKTPNIDSLLAEGTFFQNAYTMGSPHGALCVPSRAMLMTGRNLWHIGPRNPETGAVDVGRIREEFTTWPEVFRANGYETFGTGKWHNNRDAFNRLFSHGGAIYFGGMHWPDTNGHFEPRIHWFDPTSDYPESDRKHLKTFSSELYADGAIDFLQNTRDKEKPFVIYVAFSSPHDPRSAPQEYHDMYPPAEIELPPNFAPIHPFDNGDMNVRDEKLSPVPRTVERTKKEISDYYAMVSEVDFHIGRILAELKRQGLDRNTIVVFAGDHGLAVGQHGLLGKQNVYEHSMGLPLVFRGPGIPRGRTRESFVYHHDAGPTLLELAGLEVPETMESKSLVEAIKSPGVQVRESIYLSYQNKQRAVRVGDLKLILYNVDGVERTQLFDLSTDPWEMQNLFILYGRPGEFGPGQRLLNALRARMKEEDDPAYEIFFGSSSEEDRIEQ